jgi:hypothetical protein
MSGCLGVSDDVGEVDCDCKGLLYYKDVRRVGYRDFCKSYDRLGTEEKSCLKIEDIDEEKYNYIRSYMLETREKLKTIKTLKSMNGGR